MAHRAGFVNILGRPNVGKSTLMNALVGEQLAVITSKAQTTRHRILGIVNGDDFQIVYSDTPGIINPAYKLHEAMMSFVSTSLEDADVVLFMLDPSIQDEVPEDYLEQLNGLKTPLFLIINKTDLMTEEELDEYEKKWSKQIKNERVFKISALKKEGLERLTEAIHENIPECPPYFDKDALTDRPEKFFVAEIVREKILKHYREEIPYNVEVVVESFKEDEKIIRIECLIYVGKQSHKGIIIGRQGKALKRVGIEARHDIEKFVGKQIHLETFVKVKENWRDNPNNLKNFGYNN